MPKIHALKVLLKAIYGRINKVSEKGIDKSQFKFRNEKAPETRYLH